MESSLRLICPSLLVSSLANPCARVEPLEVEDVEPAVTGAVVGLAAPVAVEDGAPEVVPSADWMSLRLRAPLPLVSS